MSSLEFNSMLLDISNRLSDDQLESLKFLVQDHIKKRDQETITNGLKLFQLLTERGKLAADDTEYLSQLLLQIHRQDLLAVIDSFKGRTEGSPGPEEDKLNIATKVIAENLGRNWRKLGRKLGLKEVKLNSISQKHPTDLEETAVELLKEWRKSRGAEARTEELVQALRDCQLNMTADNVEEKLEEMQS